MIEERKEEYYEILGRCSQSWHESENEILPWWNYFLSILRQAYREFEEKITSTEMHSAKSDSVRKLICSQVEQFTLAEISRQLPSVSSQLIKKILSELKAKGIVTLRGRGRGSQMGGHRINKKAKYHNSLSRFSFYKAPATFQ